jgi:ferredoxin
MTRLNELPLDKPVTIEPMKAFPRLKDLITDVSWNYTVKERIKKFKPRPPDAPDGTWRMQQQDIDRVQEFRKCIECFLCQDVCHVLRDHHKHDQFIGPRFFVYSAALEMHPLDIEDRVTELREAQGIGFCNITKCCTKVCPEEIQITDNAIIPLKERVVDEYYDPFGWLWKKVRQRNERAPEPERYRLLNEPAEAESICLDILATDPENQAATIILLLALTDRFSKGYGVSDTQANQLLARIKGEYERAYYGGILAERRAKAKLAQGHPGAAHHAYDELCEAMRQFEIAEKIRPPGNDDALLRWNTCARLMARNKLAALEEERSEPVLE